MTALDDASIEELQAAARQLRADGNASGADMLEAVMRRRQELDAAIVKMRQETKALRDQLAPTARQRAAAERASVDAAFMRRWHQANRESSEEGGITGRHIQLAQLAYSNQRAHEREVAT